MSCRLLTLFAALLLVSVTAMAGDAEPMDCTEAERQAVELQNLRDVNASEGVRRGVEALDALRVGGEVCPAGEARLLRAVALNLIVLGQFDAARDRMERALALLDEFGLDEPGLLADVHLTAGNTYWNLEMQDEALVYYQSAMQASVTAGDLVGAGRAAGNIGNLYNTTGDLERAREYHERGLALFREADWPIGIAGTLINLAALAGRAAEAAEQNDDAESAVLAYQRMREHGLEALERFEQLGNPRGIAHAAVNAGTAMERLGDLDGALSYLERAMEAQGLVGDFRAEFHLLIALARTHARLGQHERAAGLLEQAAGSVPEGNLAISKVLAERWVELEVDRGNFEAAMGHQQEIIALNREISLGQMSARVEEVRLAMETEQRQQELELLRREAEINELRYDQQRVMLVAAALAAGLLAILLLLLYVRYRQRVEISRQLDSAARTDPMTGLPNRRDMLERLAAAQAECVASGRVFGLVMADIDGFKQINDRHGHAAGDDALRHLADHLRRSLGGEAVLARWGGDELMLLLPDTDLQGAYAMAENLRHAVDTRPVGIEANRFPLTVTLGVTELKGDNSFDKAIAAADEAMHRGKRGGRNRTECQAVAAT